MVRLLLSYGADVNALDNAMNTALHLTCQSPQRRLIAFYLAMVSSTHCSLYVCLSLCLSVCLSVYVFAALCNNVHGSRRNVTADDTSLVISDDLLWRNQSQRSCFAVIG